MSNWNEWVSSSAIGYLIWQFFVLRKRVKILETQLTETAIQSNTNEMNVNHLYYLREVDDAKTAVGFDLRLLSDSKQELGVKNEYLAARNKRLMTGE